VSSRRRDYGTPQTVFAPRTASRPADWLAKLLLAVAVLAVCPGCGNGRLPIEGAVTLNGLDVDDGTICFEPAGGQGPTTGGKIIAGQYRLTGSSAAAPGKKIVRIHAVRKTGRKVTDQFHPTVAIDAIESYIPDKYDSQSVLTCDVAAPGPNIANFHLKSP
jgi:hypothetical protein